MKKTIIVLFSVFTMCGVQGQSFKQQGASVENVVPEGWNHYETTGDMNKDGIADVAVMASANNNQPLFAIYWGTADGKLTLWKEYGELLPADENTDCTNNFTFEITNRGVLNITIQPECSQGSYSTNINRYSYRFQNGDFFLIGKEEESIQRNTGDVEVVSENYLTWKRQVKKSKISDDTMPIEKWTRLQKRPLEKLGDHLLY